MDPRTCKKIIVFGGSFDPPHVAHVKLPSLVMRAIGADAVVYVPAGAQPFKIDRQPTPASHRLAMLRLALRDQPHAHIITDEIDRAAGSPRQPTYTADTLESLRKQLGPTVTMRLLIGGDNLRVFDQWREPGRIVELAEPVVMVRPPDTREQLLGHLPKGFDPEQWKNRFVDIPVMDVSSTDIRGRAARGQPITGLVSPGVEAYIREHGLYQR